MIWLIGSHGMLGSELGRQLSENNISWVGSNSDVDISNPSALEAFAESHDSSAGQTGNAAANGKVPEKITWVVNCAAYTQVDKAEQEAEKAKRTNEDGARNIARVARKIGAKLIHISSDYVFDGTASQPYTEDAPKNPVSAYGKSKSDGEDAVAKEMTQYYILRTSWLYGFDGHNFVYTMTKAMNSRSAVRVVNDQRGTPTCTVTLASIILKIISTSANAHHLFGKNAAIPYGLYHATDGGETTWYGFTQKIYEYGKKYGRITQDCEISPCTTADYPTPAHRPAYSVLSKEKLLGALKVKLPAWDEVLEKFIKSDRFNAGNA